MAIFFLFSMPQRLEIGRQEKREKVFFLILGCQGDWRKCQKRLEMRQFFVEKEKKIAGENAVILDDDVAFCIEFICQYSCNPICNYVIQYAKYK